MSFTEKTDTGTSNVSDGTTNVTMVSSPSASGVRKVVRSITFHNTNATAREVTMEYYNGTAARVVLVRTLVQDETLVWNNILVLDGTTDLIRFRLDGGTDDVDFTATYAEVT